MALGQPDGPADQGLSDRENLCGISRRQGDRLFFGWIHSLEHIHWHEYFHVADDNSLVLDTISFPAFGAGIPENKGKKTWVDEKGNIYMDEIGQVFPRIDWLNSHYATREIRLNDQLITSGRLLPEHTRLTLIIEKRGYFDGRFEETLDRIGCRRLLPGSRQ